MKKLFYILLLIGSRAWAQTTVTGTIVDPNGNSYANGTASAYTVATSGQPTTSTSPVATNSTGLFTLSLNANTYVFTICAPPVGLGPTQNPTPTQVCFTSNPIAISGPSQDISTQLNALAKVIGPNRNITGNAVAPVSRASIQAGATADVQISNAITALSGGSGTIWADYSTAQTWAACPTWGSGNVNIVLYAVTFTVSTNCTIPANVSIQHMLGSLLSPANGKVITYLACPIAGSYPIFGNALNGQGAIDFNGNTCAFAVHPEWWGASPSASATLNTSAIQAAEYAAFGCNTSPATSCHTNGSNLSQYNKPLEFCSKLSINGEITFYHVINFIIRGCGKQNSGITQGAANKRIIDGQNIAYGTIHDIVFSDAANNTGPLIDLDNDGTHGSDLSPQNITFHDVFFAGNGSDDVGVLISKSGSGAQGDNIRCYNCYFLSFSGAGWQVGGDNTGRNAGRFFATNALKQLIKGGDCQTNPLYCVAVYGGSIEVDGITMENDSPVFGTQTGFDMLCTSPQDRCVMRNVRSESHKLASGVGLIEHSRTLFQASSWYSASRSQSLAGTTISSTGGIFSGTGQGGDGKYYQFTSTGTLGGLGLTSATSGSATTIVCSGCSFTTNTFVGQQATIISGAGKGEYCVITANNGTTITCSGGWVTNYYQLAIVNPDATSQFVVEPNWSSNPTSSGTVSFALFDFQVIGGCVGGGSTQGSAGNCEIFDVQAPGGTSNLGGQGNYILNFYPSRSDFGGSGLDDAIITNNLSNIVIERPDSAISVGGTTKYFPWSLARITLGGATVYSGPAFWNIGTMPICWSYGGNGGGVAANDVCIGVRTDNGSTTSASRAVLGNLGTIGPVTPFGTDQNGVVERIQGGLPTGAGTPGDIAFSTGNAGSSGNTVIDGTDRWKIAGSTGHLFAVADNTYDIGAVGANRPRNLYVAGVATLGSGSTKLIQTNTASNSDLAGELSFSAATTSNSYSFTGTYTSHPECTITPQFSPGASHVIWISTLSTSALQLSSDTAQTGAVSYICIGRN